MIGTMTTATTSAPGLCRACGGKGWKLLTLRRSVGTVADATERGPVRRRRVPCLDCGGTGTAAEGECR